jgi:3-mercaptopyruvate sulfurtransferase SseA
MRKEDRRQGRTQIASTFLPLTFVICVALVSAAYSGEKPASELQPGSPELMQPQELVSLLQSSAAKPVVMYVGPRFLYAQAHVPGAEFIGPATDSQSIERLRKRAAGLPKNAAIVLYCGCCPWEHCPNIRPAFSELQKLGFTKVKALYLANSFGTNWVEKGYSVEKGEAR